MFVPKYLSKEQIDHLFKGWLPQAEIKCAELWLNHNLNPENKLFRVELEQASEKLDFLEKEKARWLSHFSPG